MIKYKLLAVALSAFIVFAKDISKLHAEGTKTGVALLAGKLFDDIYVPETSVPATTETLTVSASVYFPEPQQTDDTPFITADGSKINKKNPRKHRWIAVSRDLHSRWGGDINYGDSLLVSGISEELDGYYIVRDTMNRRIRNQIDILVGRKDNIMGFWEEIQIARLN